AGARVGRSIALSSSQTCRHINTRGLLIQAEVSKTHLVSFGLQPSRCTGVCRTRLLFFLLEGTPARRFFVLELARNPKLASDVLFGGRTSKADRRSRGIRHRFLREIHTTHYHSQSIACWQFLSRESRLYVPNFLFPRLRSGSFRAFKSGIIHESRSGKRPTFPA